MNFGRRSLLSVPAGVRYASGHHHAPAKHIDLNIPLEGVEARWSSLVTEQKDVVVKQAQELMKQDWKKLSLAQKNTLYFVAFRSNEYAPTETGKIIGGIVMLIGVTVATFLGLRSLTPAPPRTMTKEWKDAETEYAKKQNANPISGISSEGYKGKGMAGSLSMS